MSADQIPLMDQNIAQLDPEIAAVLDGELARQQGTLEMIASENFVPRAVLQAQGSVLTNKYAEGYPGRRYYGGCEQVDIAETIAITRAKELFGAEHANVQPHSGATANAAVLHALINAGDKILGLELAHGGHLTHGMKINFSGKLYQVGAYGVDPQTFLVDMDVVREKALEQRPDVIIGGWSAYPRQLDFAAFRSIADEVGAKLWVDMAHFAGLVAAGLHPSPVPHSDVVSSTVHKTIGGPRSGFILSREEYAKKIDSAVFPGQQGGPLMHVIAAKAVAFKVAATRGVQGPPAAHARRRPPHRRAPLRAGRRRGRCLRPDGRHRRAPGPGGPAALRPGRPAGRGPPALGRHHREPQRGAVRPAPPARHLRPAHRHAGAGHARLRRRRVHRGGGHHRERADQRCRHGRRGAQGPGAQAHRRLPAVLRPAAVLMTAQLLDGTATAARIKAELTERVVALAARGVRPGLGTLLVGDDPGSRWYVAGKHKDCAEVGIASIREDLPATATQDEIEAAVQRLNEDPECTGFIVQLPLPKGIDANRVLELVDPDKDADGLHPTNLGRLVLRVNEPVTSPLPCTPRGIIDLLLRHDIDLRGADVVIVGRGVTVGRSIGLLLTRREINATVTLTHTGTEDLAEHTRNADVVIAAAGVPGIITADIIKPGAVVIDVGVSRSTDPETGKSRVVGDVDPGVREVASWVSPNPGGVGPMTRAMLLSNVVDTAERLLG